MPCMVSTDPGIKEMKKKQNRIIYLTEEHLIALLLKASARIEFHFCRPIQSKSKKHAQKLEGST